jgi:hypothetical protein
MMDAYSVPSLKTIGLLFGGAIALFIASAWLTAQGAEDHELYSFPALLFGMILMVIALVLFALRTLNRRHPTPPHT